MTTDDGVGVEHGEIQIEITPATDSPQRPQQQQEKEEQQKPADVDEDDEFDYGDEYFTTTTITSPVTVVVDKQAESDPSNQTTNNQTDSHHQEEVTNKETVETETQNPQMASTKVDHQEQIDTNETQGACDDASEPVTNGDEDEWPELEINEKNGNLF